MKKSTLPSSTLSIIVFSFFVCFSSTLLLGSMAEEPQKQAGAAEDASAAVHIVYVEQPPEGQVAEDYHLRTLASVLGSEDAAKEALVYSYSHAASGFSAKLTPKQVEEMSNKPGVLQVVPSRTLHLHSPTTGGGGVGIGGIHHFGGV